MHNFPIDSDGLYYGNEIIVSIGQGLNNFVDTIEFGQNPDSSQNAGYEFQNLGWAYNSTGSSYNYSLGSSTGKKCSVHYNWAGNNQTCMSERWDSYSADHNYYHAGNDVIPID